MFVIDFYGSLNVCVCVCAHVWVCYTYQRLSVLTLLVSANLFYR